MGTAETRYKNTGTRHYVIAICQLLISVKKRILVYFYYTGKPKSINPVSILRKIRNRRSEKKIKEIHHGKLYGYLMEVADKSNSTGCEFSDYYTIWEELNRLNPKRILECGSGISSVVFAYYISTLKEPESVIFVSMDSEKYWYDEIVRIFPDTLRNFVSFHYSELAETFYNEFLGCHYKEIPRHNYDFIFIDGPVLKKNLLDRNDIKHFNSDLIDLVCDHPGISISGLLDQRIDTLWKFKKLIPGGKITYKASRKMSYLRNINKHQLIPIARRLVRQDQHS